LQASGIQKFFCKRCKKYQQARYKRRGWLAKVNNQISRLLVEGMGIRSIPRILRIALSTVIRKIKLMGAGLKQPARNNIGGIYEIDELWTYVGRKSEETWLMYSLDRKTKGVLSFKIGQRTRENLKNIVDTTIEQAPKRICTDGLKVYPGLIPNCIHKTNPLSTCHIERFNLNLRTHLKRLSRKTICFSKSKEMLEACLKIYFWGRCSLT
jgi:IS1 family transposase